jgi:hypothetical protein
MGRRLPSPRARSAWRGGVGGGGCLRSLAASIRASRETPHPRSLPAASGREGSRPRESRGCAQLHQRRQESGQRLAGTGGRNQERGAIVAGLCEQRQLMLARRPAAACEPAAKAVRQQLGCFVRRSGQDVGRHGPRGKPLRRFRRGAAADQIEPPPQLDSRLFRDRSVGNVPVLAVEHGDVERLHRRVVVGGVAVGDAVEEIG